MVEIEEDSDRAQDDDCQLNLKETLKYSQEIDNKLCCPEIVSVSMKVSIVHSLTYYWSDRKYYGVKMPRLQPHYQCIKL